MKKPHLLFLLFLLQSTVLKANWQVKSPNNKIKVKIYQNNTNNLFYDIDLIESPSDSTRLLNNSLLGVLRGDIHFTDDLNFVQILSQQTINESYNVLHGKQTNDISNHANELIIRFQKYSKLIDVIFRVYDDGVAFRYRFPEISNNTFSVHGESSNFKLNSSSGKVYAQQYDIVPYYEFRIEERNIGQSSDNGYGYAYPMLINTQNKWMLLTESGVDENNYVSHISNSTWGNTYRIDPPIQGDATSYPQYSTSKLPWDLPWRVLMIGSDLNTIIKSNLVNNLAKPSVITNTSWIKPGNSTWSWWSDLGSPTNFVKLKTFVDLAANLNLPYSLADGTWENMTGGNLEQLVQYAATKNVKIWNWYDAGGLCRILGGNNCDFMRDSVQRNTEFARIKSWGVVGVKLDFFMSDKQTAIKLYWDILRDAARHELMVNFHGCTIPQGWQRIYPNLMTQEGVMGGEMLLFNEPFRLDSPPHNVNLVFTRNVIGSMDYTPSVIGIERVFHNSTSAHELALSIAYESGITHFADNVANYESLPELAKDLIRGLPPTWDEIKLLDGVPNDFVVVARRKGSNWHIAGLNGKSTARTVNLNFNFLEAGKFSKLIVKDGADARTLFTSEQTNLLNPITENITMLPYGGFSMVLKLTCAENLQVNNPFSNESKNIQAQMIQANNQILNNSNINFSSEKAVLLNQGFQVTNGSVFKAEIRNCN